MAGPLSNSHPQSVVFVVQPTNNGIRTQDKGTTNQGEAPRSPAVTTPMQPQPTATPIDRAAVAALPSHDLEPDQGLFAKHFKAYRQPQAVANPAVLEKFLALEGTKPPTPLELPTLGAEPPAPADPAPPVLTADSSFDATAGLLPQLKEQHGYQVSADPEQQQRFQVQTEVTHAAGDAQQVQTFTLDYQHSAFGGVNLTIANGQISASSLTIKPEALENIWQAIGEGSDQATKYIAGTVLFAGALLIAKPKQLDLPIASTLYDNKDGVTIKQATTVMYQTVDGQPSVGVKSVEVDLLEAPAEGKRSNHQHLNFNPQTGQVKLDLDSQQTPSPNASNHERFAYDSQTEQVQLNLDFQQTHDPDTKTSTRQQLSYDSQTGLASVVLDASHQQTTVSASHTVNTKTSQVVGSYVTGATVYTYSPALAFNLSGRQDFDANGQAVKPTVNLAGTYQVNAQWNLKLDSQATAVDNSSPVTGYLAVTAAYQDELGTASNTTIRRDYGPNFQPTQASLASDYAWRPNENWQAKVAAQHVMPNDPLTASSSTLTLNLDGQTPAGAQTHLVVSQNLINNQDAGTNASFDLTLKKTNEGNLNLNINLTTPPDGGHVTGRLGLFWEKAV